MLRPMKRLPLAIAALALGAATAHANGRYPSAKSISPKPGSDQDIIVGTTLGAMITHDDGAHWYWICEQNVGYGGVFDPKYEIAADDGTIYATTQNGLRVSRDGGCTFETARLRGFGQPGWPDDLWMDALDVAPDGTVWIGTTETGLPNAVYKSTDHARSFEKIGLETGTGWWKSLDVAPSDGNRIYVTGYEIAPTPRAFIERSVNGGQDWEELPLTDVQVVAEDKVLLLGVDPTNADIVYLRAGDSAGPGKDRVYRTANGGTTWTEVLATDRVVVGFVVLGDGTVLVQGPQPMEGESGCLWRSTDGGNTFGGCETGPGASYYNRDVMKCLATREDGTLFACSANWDPNFATVMRTKDGAPLTKSFRFNELSGALQCPSGTPQHDVCELRYWPGFAEQYGITGPVDAGVGGDDDGGGSKGCCDAGADGGSTALLVGIAFLAFSVERRRRVG
jgi:hypothetical protein